MNGSDGHGIDGTNGRTPRIGVTEWTNPRNRVHVLQIHYTADPAKRSPEWRIAAQHGMPRRGFAREYDIRWDVPEGEPVIPEFETVTHVTADIKPDPKSRLLRFWDFGFDSPVVLFAQLTSWDQLVLFRELCPFNITLRQLVPGALAVTGELVSHDKVFDAGDPAAYSETDLGSAAAELQQKYHIQLRATRPGTQASYDALRERCLGRVYVPGYGQQPKLLVHPSCSMLIEALCGAFHRSTFPPYKPVKVHPYKDLVDALRYGNDCLSLLNIEFMQQMSEMARIDRVW